VSHDWRKFVFLSFLYIKLFELGVEDAFYNWSAVTRNKVHLFKFPLWSSCSERTDDAFVLLIASASFTSRNPSSLSIVRLNSKIYSICKASLIATPSGHLPQKWFTKKDSGLRLYRVSWLFWLVLSPLYPVLLCLIFLAADSKKLSSSPQRALVPFFVKRGKLQHRSLLCSFFAFDDKGASRFIRNSPRHYSVLCVPFFVKRDKLELTLYLLGIIKVPPDWVVGSRNFRCHPFAACTVYMTVCFNPPTISALTSGLSRYAAQATSCWLRLVHFAYLNGCGRIFCHSHPQTSPSPLWDLFVTKILSQHKLSCILSQHEVRYPCAVDRQVGASPFFVLLHCKSFWNPSMYHVVETLPYLGHSLHRLVAFFCWFVSKLLSHDPGACAPPLLPILV